MQQKRSRESIYPLLYPGIRERGGDQFFYSPCGAEKLPGKIFPEEKKRQQQYSPCCQKEQGKRAALSKAEKESS